MAKVREVIFVAGWLGACVCGSCQRVRLRILREPVYGNGVGTVGVRASGVREKSALGRIRGREVFVGEGRAWVGGKRGRRVHRI